MMKTFVQFELIPTLRLEAMQGLSLKTSNFTLNCLFNNYNVFIPGPIVFGNIVMVNKGTCAIWDNSYFAFGRYARFKPRIIEFCNLILYLIFIMFLYHCQ